MTIETVVYGPPRVAWKHRSFWWARRHPEQALPPDVCAKDGTTGTSPFDVYCSGGEDHFILFSRSPLLHHGLLYSFRVTIGALALAAASMKIAAPLYAAAALVGFALLAFPLRAFRSSRTMTAGIWLAAFGFAASDYEGAIGTTTLHVVTTAAVAGVALTIVAAVTFYAYESRLSAGGNEVAVRTVASGLVVGCLLVIASLLDGSSLGAQVVDISSSLRHFALLFGAAALAGSCAVAAAFGFLRGVRVTDREVPRLIVKRPGLRELRLSVPPPLQRPVFRRGALAARLVFMLNAAAVALARRSVHAVNAVLRLLARTELLLVRLVIALVNAFHHLVVLVARALASALRAMLRLLADALTTVVHPLRHVGRSTVATVTLVSLGAVLSMFGAHRFSVYLTTGGIENGLLALVLTGAASALLATSWWTSTGHPAAEVAGAAGRLLERAGATAYITVLALAWADGILGWLGVGPITPGWLTASATALLLLVVVVTEIRNPELFRRRTASQPD